MGAVSNIGILAVEAYFPSQFVSHLITQTVCFILKLLTTAAHLYTDHLHLLQVDQAELEKHDNVSAGKYTIGLGQV